MASTTINETRPAEPRPCVASPTPNGAIDTSPSYAPDGHAIVFSSDRGGSQQALYRWIRQRRRTSSASASARAATHTPVWSPRGDLIAFTKQHGGQFFIGVMKSDGSGERLLTQSWLDEGPSWSPNGRVILSSAANLRAVACVQIARKSVIRSMSRAATCAKCRHPSDAIRSRLVTASFAIAKTFNFT